MECRRLLINSKLFDNIQFPITVFSKKSFGSEHLFINCRYSCPQNKQFGADIADSFKLLFCQEAVLFAGMIAP